MIKRIAHIFFHYLYIILPYTFKTARVLRVPAYVTRWKEWYELKHWKDRKITEEILSNDHYVKFYTTYFGLNSEFYAGKRILDIGCGPCGSLEWADTASERIGLDPLANQYIKLGANEHVMKYVKAYAEAIPFKDHTFDVVTSFNSLDHVGDLYCTISEINRILKRGGLFLLLTFVNHKPTVTEPQEFSWDIIKKFLTSFKILDEKHYEKKAKEIYDSIEKGVLYDHSDRSKRYGILLIKLCKFIDRNPVKK